MNKIIFSILFAIGLNATCINVLNNTNEIGRLIKIDYCDDGMYHLMIKNNNKYLQDYYSNISDSEFDMLIDAYQKTISWTDKVEEAKANISKKIEIKPNELGVVFSSRDDGKSIQVLLVGFKNKIENGTFSFHNKNSLIEHSSQLEKIKKESKERIKELNSLLK